MDDFEQDLEITAEEREEVLGQIESAIAESRTPERPELTVLHAEKRGVALPLLINLTALLLIGVGVFFLVRAFELRRENITLRRSPYVAAEGTLLQTMKREKEEEIDAIRVRLERADQERRSLRRELEAEVETREAQLRRELEEALAGERERLIALGTSESETTARLRELESRELDSIDREIADHRRQLNDQLEEKEQALLVSERQSREALARASRERNELLTRLSSEQRERDAAEQRLTEINARMQGEILMKEQAAAVFAGLQEQVRGGRYDAALADLKSLEDNRTVESYLIDLLAELIQRQRAQGSGGEESAAAERLEAELSERSVRIAELEEQMRTIVEAGDGQLAKQLQSRVDALNGDLRAAGAQAERREAALRSLRSERDALAASLEGARSAQSAAVERGRDEAFRDVMTFLSFLSASGETDGDAENRLTALARQDPLFRAATREIRISIAAGGSPGELASPFSFLGIVSSVAADRAVIEAMVDVDVSVGSVIQIRRISDLDREIAIAEGTVLQVRRGKITVSFKPIDTAAAGPAGRDPVYLLVGEN